MTDGDAGDPVELVAARLRELGLDHPAIDPAETAADLLAARAVGVGEPFAPLPAP